MAAVNHTYGCFVVVKTMQKKEENFRIFDGEIVVQLEEDDVAAETEKWNLSLVAYVVGNTPSIGAMERFIANQWNFVTKPKVLLHNDGYFVIRFASAKDRNAVLFFGPYTLYNQLIILRSWSVDFDFNEEVLRTILLGVKLPNMPLKCWSERSLSKIGSGLGKPIYADECTSKAERISYSRLLIEMDVSRPLPGTIKLKDEMKKLAKREPGKVEDRIAQAREKLKTIQIQMRDPAGA
ncbi:uncharacterized protein [Nicotiana tomentosiformis]|uniref:uncharacterized protein n=1 Tax=Nicotiana tomentosiformis TaxID=4098 RepID=UPI00388C59C5